MKELRLGEVSGLEATNLALAEQVLGFWGSL